MTTQLKVATSSSSYLQKRNNILHVMSRYPEGITPKMIALHTSINVNTVKSLLPKIKGIKKIMRGVYKVAKGGDGPIASSSRELTDWNFHNLHLQAQIPVTQSSTETSVFELGLIKLTITINYIKGRAYLTASTDYPMNISSICLVSDYFERQLYGTVGYFPTTIYIKTIEFNKDYSNLRLDGVQCISLDSLVEQFKVYQKKRGMRIEHKTKVPIGVNDVVDMLTHSPNTTDLHIKLNELTKQVAKLTNAMLRRK